MTRTMLITGVSSGLGKALAQEALAQRWHVVGTVRTQKDASAFEASSPGGAFARILDVRETVRMAQLVCAIEADVGPIDVLVNNAGYGLASTVEEASLDEIRAQFEVNVFGCIAMLHAVLPGMRARRAGRILNITSMGGLVSFPGVGIYTATKFAMEGITEALRQEVREFGIWVTAIEPGMFPTDWSGRSQRQGAARIDDYARQRDERAARTLAWSGDVAKAARAMLTILDDPQPPGHLLLGSIANELVGKKLDTLQREFPSYEALSVSTDGPTAGIRTTPV